MAAQNAVQKRLSDLVAPYATFSRVWAIMHKETMDINLLLDIESKFEHQMCYPRLFEKHDSYCLGGEFISISIDNFHSLCICAMSKFATQYWGKGGEEEDDT